jgi:lysozyme
MTAKTKKPMAISDDGLDVLTEREGCKLTAYKDSVGVWTIGVGHTSAAGPPKVVSGMTITEQQASEILDQDLDQFEDCVNTSIHKPMKQFQFDAFVSICFNIGTGGFAGSTFVRKFNEGDVEGAGDAILMWNKPPEIVPRRQGEFVQFWGGYVPRIKTLGT